MDDDILQEFLAESWENLGRLDTEIVELEKHPNSPELIASIFRTIHTIKGTCGFIGLTGLGAVAHSTENVLGRMRDGELTVTPSAISVVLDGIDRIKEYLVGLEASGSEPVIESVELIDRLDSFASGRFESEATMPAMTDSPAVEVLDPEPAPPVTTAAPAKVEPMALADPPSEATPAKTTVADLSIRVNVDVLDSLMNLVGELVLTRNQLLQMVRGDDETRYAAPIVHLNRVTTDLQEGVMKTRMQPIGNAWSKLPRLVRDLSQATGKQIELEMTGAETELDRTVLDAIKDPLTHMVRNSADHGVETPEARQAAGKPTTGCVKLQAYHEGGHVIIRVEDDGRGIDARRILRKAVERGLTTEAEGANLTEGEILSFIFKPGFSTAETITAISGRGVGMDVVKTAIERISGTVDLSSRLGQGTTIRVKIPLTLAIISALVVQSGSECFAVPQLGVVELVRLSAEDRKKIEHIHGTEVFRLRDRLLPLIHLDRVLRLDDAESPREGDVNIVIVQVGEEHFGLIVDEVFDTEEIVVKPVGRLLQNIGIYQGTTILGDGRVIMILDVAGIADRFGGLGAGNPAQGRRIEEVAAGEETTSLLLLDVGGNAPMAVPLSLVARLEEFRHEKIERTGDRLVMQYRGELLPLLPAAPGQPLESFPDPQPVVVFSDNQNSLGLLVHRIQDIIEEPLIFRMNSQRPGILGTAVINEVATDIIDIQYFLTQANPKWFDNTRKAARRHVLVVDESMFFRQLVRTALEREDFIVTVADSVEKALNAIERDPGIDIVVSELEFSESSGLKLATEARRRRESHELKAVAMVSPVHAESESAALEAGFDRLLVKFDANRLVQTINELVRPKLLVKGESA